MGEGGVGQASLGQVRVVRDERRLERRQRRARLRVREQVRETGYDTNKRSQRDFRGH